MSAHDLGAQVMTTNIGIWLDHHMAVIVALTGDAEERCRVMSDAEKRPHRSGQANSKTPYGRQDAQPDDKRESVFTEHLAAYFDVLISRIAHADAFFVFGPGEAKEKLVERIERFLLGGRISDVETAGRMSDHQIAAKVRKYFSAEAGDSQDGRRHHGKGA
jgi:hypothetical protein